MYFKHKFEIANDSFKIVKDVITNKHTAQNMTNISLWKTPNRFQVNETDGNQTNGFINFGKQPFTYFQYWIHFLMQIMQPNRM